jgi:hypothetical protein
LKASDNYIFVNRLVKELDKLKDLIINGNELPEIPQLANEDLFKKIVLKVEAQIRFEVYAKIICLGENGGSIDR